MDIIKSLTAARRTNDLSLKDQNQILNDGWWTEVLCWLLRDEHIAWWWIWSRRWWRTCLPDNDHVLPGEELLVTCWLCEARYVYDPLKRKNVPSELWTMKEPSFSNGFSLKWKATSHLQIIWICCSLLSCSKHQNGYKDQIIPDHYDLHVQWWIKYHVDRQIDSSCLNCCTNCLFSCLYVTKRKQLSKLLYLPLAAGILRLGVVSLVGHSTVLTIGRKHYWLR